MGILAEEPIFFKNERRIERRKRLIEGFEDVRKPEVLEDLATDSVLSAAGTAASGAVRVILGPMVKRFIEEKPFGLIKRIGK